MTGSKAGEASIRGLLGDVEVVLRDGTTLVGAIDNFNPRSTGFFLLIAGGARPSSRNLLFEAVRWVAFKGRLGGLPAPSLQPDDRLIQVRFDDGSLLRGITAHASGGRAGFFLVPSEREDIERVFIPVSAVREVISLERLGDILEREGLVEPEVVRAALKHQEELRKEKVGTILVRKGRLAQEQLSEGLQLQGGVGERRLGQILRDRGFISEEDLSEALHVQEEQRGKRLGEVMVEMGLATKKMIAIAVAIQYNVPFVDLTAQAFDPRLRVLVPEELASKHVCLPLSVQQGVLTLAVPDPTDLRGRDEVRQSTGMTTVIVVAAETDIHRAIGRYYKATTSAE
jgi:hypothetical protein